MQITIDTNTGIITINGETLEIKGQGKPIEHTVTLLHTPEETKAEKTKRLWMVWADRFGIKREYIEEHVEFQENGDVIWDGNCNWDNKGFTEFPPNFVEVTGTFSCENNQLTSLEGCSQTVGGGFYCGYNQLTSLEGAPQTVEGAFWCDNNQLTNLEGCPQTVGGNFYCNNNPLLTTFPAGIHIGGLVYISEDQQQLKADAKLKWYAVSIW